MNVSVGTRVKMTEERLRGPGYFTGTVTEVNDHWLVIMPDAPALRDWYPAGYRLGSAHWSTRLSLIDTGAGYFVPRVISWDWKEQIPLDTLKRDIEAVSGGTAYVYEADTHSDQIALVISAIPLTDQGVADAYDYVWRRSTD